MLADEGDVAAILHRLRRAQGDRTSLTEAELEKLFLTLA